MVDRRLFGRLALITLLALGLPTVATPPTKATLGTPPQPEWSALKPAQRKILAPLVDEWPQMTHVRRKQWLVTAERYPSMTRTEKDRVQKRMRDWVRMSPQQHATARENHKKIQALPESQKESIKKKWAAYENLPTQDKQDVRERHKSAILLAPPPAPESMRSDETLGAAR